ncbi:ABC transporter substrate-binding protein [Actinospica robiniae]|uniref:ABC transporter substrate-binding protein n=1 Tax=Actinospica robiniae TaxID=304901 RepID=UPI0003F57412|nr:ABC transporter substrate-binding protein [Actinospica robiniae]
MFRIPLHRARPAVTLLAVVLAATAAGCSSNASSPSSPASGGAAAAPAVNISFALSNKTNQTYLPLVLAESLGYFKKEGINLSIVSVTSGSLAWTDMIAGKVNGVIGFYDHNIDLRAKGTATESVIQLNQAPGMAELVRTDEAATITSPADESDKKLGITGLGSSTEFLAEYLAAHNGVDVSTLHPVAIAAGPTFIAAMQHDEVDLGVTTEPTISSLLSQKAAKIIVDLRSASGTEAALGGPYPGTALSFETSYVQQHHDTVQRIVNALEMGLKYVQSHSVEQIAAVIPSWFLGTASKTAWEESLANEIGVYSPTGLMPADGPQSVNRVLSAFDPQVKGKTVDLSQTYTDAFVQAASSTS